VLWTPETGAVTLGGGRRRLMGLPGGDAPVETVGFPRGAVMVSFTDGLVERRDEPLAISIEGVCRYLEAHHDRPAQEIADGLLVARFGVDPSAGLRRDDTALAVIAHR
jgi:serine phosphatase RsbU (regulator of sigma subunit)